jgi:NAD(P)-dependent dehydrogenase (short-subunit alcohol dehydrogenase family)
MGKLSGRVGIVTGASSGIGAAIAKALAAEGMAVVLAARRKDRLEALAAEIEAAGGRARACQTDVSVEDDVICLFHAANNEFARLDLLVNCAGFTDPTPTHELSLAVWRAIIDVNLTAAFLCSREALRVMRPQKRGRIINIGSISAKVPRPDSIGYTTTKFALDGLTRSLALDGRAHGITVSIIHPGAAATELVPDMDKRPAADTMQAVEVASIAVLMASLPDETNLLEATILPVAQPFLGRG